MALDLDCNTTIKYTGDGVQTDFLYPFPIIEDTDLNVAFFDEEKNEYNEVTGWSKPDSTSLVRFTVPPGAGQEFVIYRLTDIDPMKAIFHPGHPVKAGDLNDNFEQLQKAIEDNRCIIELKDDVYDERYWRKYDETIYSDDEWISSDDYVASTAAIDGRVDDKLEDFRMVAVGPNPPLNPNQGDLWWSTVRVNLFIWYEDVDSAQWVDASPLDIDLDPIQDQIDQIVIDINKLDLEKLDKQSGIKKENQIQTNGEWINSDTNFAYTSALSERYDVILLPEGENTPQEDEDYPYIQPGKFLITSDNNLYAWNGDAWFQPITGSSGGGGGSDPTKIKTNNPITQSYQESTNTYTLNFDISSLKPAPTTTRTRRSN